MMVVQNQVVLQEEIKLSQIFNNSGPFIRTHNLEGLSSYTKGTGKENYY